MTVQQQPYQPVSERNNLRQFVRPSALDPEVLFERAEQDIAALKSEFMPWLLGAVRALAALKEQHAGNELLSRMEARAHEIKGTTSSYGFTVLGRIAASLYRLVVAEQRDDRNQQTAALRDLHVSTLVLFANSQDGGQMALGVAAKLEAATEKLTIG